MKETNGSGVTELANCDVDGRLEGEKREGSHWGGSEGACNSSEALVRTRVSTMSGR